MRQGVIGPNDMLTNVSAGFSPDGGVIAVVMTDAGGKESRVYVTRDAAVQLAEFLMAQVKEAERMAKPS